MTGFMVGIGLVIVAWNEFRGRGLLSRFDPRGPKLLGWNQVALMGLVILHCLWSMYRTAADPTGEVLQLEELAGLPADFVTGLTISVYGFAIVLTLLFQGLNARYYFARISLLADYLRETPGWIIDLQRTDLDTRSS